jgi:hypothetical protein
LVAGSRGELHAVDKAKTAESKSADFMVISKFLSMGAGFQYALRRSAKTSMRAANS